jgi:CDP-diacylglycerol--serine O-phosphatidyltransferase
MARMPLRKRRRPFELKKVMFVLPNLFTVSSIFCGFYGAVTAAGARGNAAEMYRACISILFAMVFDSVDGRVARLTRTQSAFGVQMDSLADVVSFGAAPGLIAWHWGLSAFGTAGLLACFFFCACGAIRLARFNVMAAQASGPSHFFVGLPIPAGAGLLVATIIAYLDGPPRHLTTGDVWAPILMVVIGLLMISTIKFRTFKATRLTPRAALALLVVIGCTVGVGVRVRPSFAVVTLMASYLAFGLAEESARFVRRLLSPAEADLEEEDEEDVLDEPELFGNALAEGPPLPDDDEEDLID